MNKLLSTLVLLLLSASSIAQAPEKMSYQAVIRDPGNNLVTNQSVGMQVSILQGSITGSPVYVETQTPTTNTNGLVTLEIGVGSVVSGDFTIIDWANDSYFIKTETDPTGGTSYTITGTSQLMSVPYALHAKSAESVTGALNETDPVFGGSIANGITATDTANWNSPATDTLSFIQDTDGDTKIQTEETLNENIIRFDLNGTEKWSMKNNRLETHNTGKSVFVGENAGANDDNTDNWNAAFGHEALFSNTTGSTNTALGGASMKAMQTGSSNTSIGQNAMLNSTTGFNNVALGNNTLRNNIFGSSNTMIGTQAGFNVAGSGNVFIGAFAGYNETGSDLLYMDNSATTTPLIYGDFGTDNLVINGQLGIGSAYVFPTSDGTSGQIMGTDGNGILGWINPDNLGSHIATQNITLGSNWLSGDGDNEGILIDASGNIGIGGAASATSELNVTGTITANSLKIIDFPSFSADLSAVDASGSGSWTELSGWNVSSLPHLHNNGNNLNLVNGRFVAPKDGFYFFSCNFNYFYLDDYGTLRLMIALNGNVSTENTNGIIAEHGNTFVGDYYERQVNINGVMKLSAGDYVSVFVMSIFEADDQFTISTKTGFSGYLVGEY